MNMSSGVDIHSSQRHLNIQSIQGLVTSTLNNVKVLAIANYMDSRSENQSQSLNIRHFIHK